MTHKLDIEAALERSLRSQVTAPRLDGRFDASVWARIEAAEQPASELRRAATVASGSARWLFIINAIGALVALVLIVYFGGQAFSGAEVASLPAINLAVPKVSVTLANQLLAYAPSIITAVALGFALMFTSLGRRLRSELHQFL